MALSPGTRLGPYEVTAQLGVGGMGEVYRATDTNLKRQVAIKVLPEALAADAERLARFQREAEVLAALNHPNIAAIYGLERTPSTGFGQAGPTALVMELVEGPTLADRIAQGPISVDEALPIARQIAEALEAAHEQALIHRDLKPANIKLRPDGTVKVLDFGLAKAVEPAAAASTSASMSPTITTPAMTHAGQILGTAAYMSPEQARGKPVDRRADVWAFGAVLYEMLTGRRAFDDEDISLTLSKVLQREPDFAALPAGVPLRVTRALEVCLRKDLRQRASDIHDVRLALDGAFETAATSTGDPATGTRPFWRRALPAIGAAVASGLVVGIMLWDGQPEGEHQPVRFRLTVPADVTPLGVAISPDGSTVGYTTRSAEGRSAVMIHRLRALDSNVLLREEGPRSGSARFFAPSFSPDGAWVGFVDRAEEALKKVRTTGGPAQTIVPLGVQGRRPGVPLTTAWGENDTIVFSQCGGGPLWRGPAEGGTAEPLTTLDEARGEIAHLMPAILPGGETLLFLVVRDAERLVREIAARNLVTGEQLVLVESDGFAYAPSGHIVYAQAGGAWAVPFDASQLRFSGEAVPLAAFDAQFGLAIARNGSAVYANQRTGSRQPSTTLVWTDAAGQEAPLGTPTGGRYRSPRVSPDGRRVVVRGEDNDIYVWDEARGLTRLTFDPRADTSPVWTPDGSAIVFQSMREGGGIYRKAADGTGEVEPLLVEEANDLTPSPFSWSPTGDLLFSDLDNDGIGLLRMSGEPSAEVLLDEPNAVEKRPALSPDGRWLAYQSFENNRWDIYVRPFPDVRGGLWQVSPGGGEEPVWAPGGRTLFYVEHATRRLMGAAVAATGTFAAATPTPVLDLSPYSFVLANHNNYDIGPDGRFLFAKLVDAPATESAFELVVDLDFLGELRRLAPTN